MRFIVVFISIIITFGANASELDKMVKQYVAAIISNDFEQVAELLHPDELSLFKEKINNSLQSSNQNLVEKELLPLLGVDTRQKALTLTPKDAYIRMSNNLMARYPNEATEIASSSSIYLGEARRGDILVVTYKMTYNIGDKPVSRVIQHSFKKYEDRWRFLLTAETLAYFNRYTL